jgi:hypothetical protein
MPVVCGEFTIELLSNGFTPLGGFRRSSSYGHSLSLFIKSINRYGNHDFMTGALELPQQE